eukprot:TRINITY_DN10346_c0_g1_i1.p2 TRINITY_DN10346_c0_g1~~TRINITY_DN10346_c0_g1_i1.p2  ORF type:complete len:156 (+),score=15.80 TRINITY_DN10346_c0_g1_i1:65-469(+)
MVFMIHCMLVSSTLLSIAVHAKGFASWHEHITAQIHSHPNHPADLTYDAATRKLQEKSRNGERPPIVWVPGFSSSNLTFQLNQSDSPSGLACPETTTRCALASVGAPSKDTTCMHACAAFGTRSVFVCINISKS